MAIPTRIADRIAASGGTTSGFDYLRMALAVAVLFWHSFVVGLGPEAGHAYQAGPFGAALRLILPMFFALSGFLVAASLERSRSLGVFLSFRALRLIPALAVEVALSAFLIGPLVSTLSAGRYFADPLLFGYLGNVAGVIHYVLPGVFAANPWPRIVNGSLWTVPYELECYIAITVASLLTLTRRPVAMALLAVGASLVCFALFRKGTVAGMAIDPVPGRMLVVCFLAGAALQVGRALVPYSTPLFVVSAVSAWLLLSMPEAQFLASLPAAYTTVWVGLRNPPRLWLLKQGDYSYGLYLYGFVIQQLIVFEFGSRVESPLVLFLTALLTSFGVAALSWHVIEKPMLSLKPLIARRWPLPLPRLRSWATRPD